MINRLHNHLTSVFPALDGALDLTNTGPLILLTGYQTPAAIRRTGARRLETWLRNRKVARCCPTRRDGPGGRHTSVTGEKPTAQLVRTLAKEVRRLNEQIAETDKLIEARFREHKHAEVITSMPGIGPLLGAEFLAATGGDMTAFDNPDRLAGVTPAPHASGKISGHLHRPRHEVGASSASSIPPR